LFISQIGLAAGFYFAGTLGLARSILIIYWNKGGIFQRDNRLKVND
jgi:hypothetical protein